MKVRSVLILIISIILAIDCANNKNSDQGILKIKVNPETGEILKFSEIFKDINFVQLQTDSSCFMEGVNRMEVSEDYFYFADTKHVFLFNKNGGFINKIGRIGKGPEEIISLEAFNVNDESSEVEILDYKGKKLVKYNFEGRCIDSWNTDIYAFDFCKINESKYILNSAYQPNVNSNNSLNVMENTGEDIIKSYFPINKNMAWYYYIMQTRSFYKYNDSIFYLHDPFDTIYNIQKNKLIPSRIIDFGKYKLPEEVIYNKYEDVMEYSDDVNKRAYIHHVNHFIENRSFIFFMFQYKKQKFHVYFNKANNNVNVVKSYEDDIHFNSTIFTVDYRFTPWAYDNEAFYFILEPFAFIKIIEEIKAGMDETAWVQYIYNHKEVLDIYNSISNNDNPIVGIFKLR